MAASMDQVIVNSLKEGLLAQKSEQMPSDSDDQPSSSTFTRTVSRFSTRRGSSRLLSRRASGSASESEALDSEAPSVAFRINIGVADDSRGGSPGSFAQDAYMNIDVHHEAVQEAVQGAVHGAVHQAVDDAVKVAVMEHVQGAVQQVLASHSKFDVRANTLTLIAITGVIIFWRGIWTMWDYWFGFGLTSECASVVVGLGIMITFRLLNVPLLDGLPSG